MNNNRKRVLVACSGGPDSMALLDMVKNTVQLPYYDKAVVDFSKKTITLVSYSERILVEDDQD